MLRQLLLFLLLVVSLSALNNNEILKRANGFMKSSSKSNHFRAYNDYKNLYLRSIMLEDIKLRASSLKGIVNSGTKLRIDISSYKSELAGLNPNKKSTKTIQKSKYKPYIPKRNKSKDIKVRSSHKLKSIAFKNSTLVLEFDKKLSSNQINYFTLYDPKKEQFRYVFDIHASMHSQSKSLRKKGVKRIKLAQYKPNTLRLVIENTKKLKVRFSKKSNRLEVSINGNSKYTKSTAIAQKKQTPLRRDRNKTIVIDAGHGGKDPGAVGYKKYREKIIVMKIAKELRKILKSRGYKVYMTRDRDKFVKLSKRTKYANRKDGNIFISIHANAVAKKNAHKVHGIECYFLSKSRTNRAKRVAAKENSADLSDMNFYGKESFLNTISSHNMIASNKLAIDLQRGMLGSVKKSYKNVKDGGVREGPFWVLVGAQMPSVLVEVGFITHPTEAKRLVSSKYQKKLAQGLANGVERYFANCI
ncbi:MAG: N-acetylmuramoyl-L-alanine amidase [Sulfurimonas sp.]|jgi:N-acetylmuramoyl-L-alanine amidase|uniref:N-acetylmuramoyl-L-alanine amidase n=1 Tax=Sulfurimonas sp. TaxID=2022749 RepID=UPI0039E3F5FF